MTYYQTITMRPCPNLNYVREFLCKNGMALARAAHKLGGSVASAQVFLLIEEVNHTLRLTYDHGNQLVDLHRLLTLEHVGDPDRIESGLFAEIDLSSRFVEDCCCLADKLGSLVALIMDERPDCDIQEGLPLAFNEVA
tara:strand:- start:9 stop:422 length:414 start_codon:yes stop_codon:yes gene_type:complete